MHVVVLSDTHAPLLEEAPVAVAIHLRTETDHWWRLQRQHVPACKSAVDIAAPLPVHSRSSTGRAQP
jgi:hypothetical protein